MQKQGVVIVCGHYGAGKTNFALNLAYDAARDGSKVTLVDLDIVNPYFRSSDYAQELESAGINLIAPVFASRGTSLDVPSLTGAIAPAIECAQSEPEQLLIIDAGGDDVGATALSRFADVIEQAPYEMLYVINARRNLTQTPDEALWVLQEIEQASRLHASALVNNTHLQDETSIEVIKEGIVFAKEVASETNLPLLCTTYPAQLDSIVTNRETLSACPTTALQKLYPVQIYVRKPWEC